MRNTLAAVSGLAVLFLLSIPCHAHSPVDCLEVFQVTPARQVDHDVELQSRLDNDRAKVALLGPTHFCRSIGALRRPVKQTIAYLTWFKISNPAQAKSRKVKVLDLVRGGGDSMLTVGTAEYFLSSAQLIADGAPDPIPAGLDFYKAYRVLDPPDVNREVTLTNSESTRVRRLSKPQFVCVATKQWHHEEFVDASHPNDCFVVYELASEASDEKVSTIDQFGLNELKHESSRWLCVRGALLSID